MKSKTTLSIPDSFYEVLGFTMPFSTTMESTAYMPGESITDFIGSQRVNTLKRESKYKAYYPKLRNINLLRFNYPNVPQDTLSKVDYIKKIIRRNILKVFTSISPENKLNDDCLKYINGILSIYENQIQTKWIKRGYSKESEIALQALRSSEAILISFLHNPNLTIYANPFCIKKREGYYFLKSNPEKLAHIIDLTGFLADILLIQTINQIQLDSQLPIIQDIIANYLHVNSEPQCNELERSALTDFLQSGKVLSVSHLFYAYTFKDTSYFHVGLSTYMLRNLIALFCEILEVYQNIQYENKNREEMSRTVATAYMTKKNIPNNILNAMEHTAFKNYFKYVEFDKDIDLTSVKTIEKEFKVLNEAYFSGKAFFDVTLRIRKLGKHKACGLYYPNLQTLCIDLRSPASFSHEYFHMIDDRMGDLSLDTAFQNIVKEYKSAFLNNMEQMGSTIKSQLMGRGKYNLQYFFRRAEIFARCGEIYLTRILKVESSLIHPHPDLKYAYPKSEQMDELIKKYYEDLLYVKLAQSDFADAINGKELLCQKS